MQNKGGRPRKKADEKRTHQIHLYLNKEEYDLLQSRYKKSQYPTRRQFLIDLMQKRNITQLPAITIDAYQLLQDIHTELTKQGVNLNQITKNSNTYNIIPPELTHLINDNKEIKKAVEKTINDIKSAIYDSKDTERD